MIGRAGMVRACMVMAMLAACGKDAKKKPSRPDDSNLPPAQRDAEALAREVLEMVDRAIDYRGSHRGRPATSLRQMGIDSLTPAMVRRIVNVDRDPVITVAYRQPDQHEIISCRGDGQILEEAAVGGGRFTVMCENNAGAQRPIQVGGTTSP
jgi:hypothetical protein